MKKNGYTAIEMLVVVVVLGVFVLVMISTTSYAYKDRTGEYYSETVHLIEKQAVVYGETLNNLEEEGNIIITLNDLIEAGYFVADDDDGNVIDPRNSNATLNGLKIKLTYENDEINADVIEDE